MAQTDAAKKERLFTPYRIWRTDDEGRTAEWLGDVAAGSSDEALRKWFADPPRDEEEEGVWFAAVSVNSQRWRRVAARVTTKLSEPTSESPAGAAPEDVAPDAPAAQETLA